MVTFQHALARGVRISAAVFTLLVSGLLAAAQAQGPDVNTVKRIQTAGDVVEIEVHSNREFPIRNQVVVLRIGTQEFFRSKSPEDGSLKTLIFMLSPDQFAALPDGAAMTVKYGREKDGAGDLEIASAARGLKWDFGKLNKAIHQQ
jgi:hypothetical protein